jgi:lipid A disaccharide synthetase
MTLPNLIAEQTIMPEFLAVGKSQKAVEQAIASMDRLLSDPDELTRQREQLKALNDRFATPGAAQRTARSLLKRLGSNDVASSVGDIVGSDDPSFSAAPETDERAA